MSPLVASSLEGSTWGIKGWDGATLDRIVAKPGDDRSSTIAAALMLRCGASS